jgi:site-specific DNA-adenine methylase
MVDKVSQVIANDNDNDIFNLFQVVRLHKDQLIKALRMMPIHESLLTYWKNHEESDPVWKAVAFLLRSNFTYLGGGDCLCFRISHTKSILVQDIEAFFLKMAPVQWMCCEYQDVIKKIDWRRDNDKNTTFIYADPPYCQTAHNYQNGFTQEETDALLAYLCNSGIQFGMSEFHSEYIESLAKKYHLFYTTITERRTLKSRNTEVFLSNYEPYWQTQLRLF